MMHLVMMCFAYFQAGLAVFSLWMVEFTLRHEMVLRTEHDAKVDEVLATYPSHARMFAYMAIFLAAWSHFV